MAPGRLPASVGAVLLGLLVSGCASSSQGPDPITTWDPLPLVGSAFEARDGTANATEVAESLLPCSAKDCGRDYAFTVHEETLVSARLVVLAGAYSLNLSGPSGDVALDSAPVAAEGVSATAYRASLEEAGNYSFQVRPASDQGSYRFNYTLAPDVPTKVVTLVQEVKEDTCSLCGWFFGGGAVLGLIVGVVVVLVFRRDGSG